MTLTNALPVTSGGTGIATADQGALLSATSANTFSATRTPTLGLAGTAAGTLGLSGLTSGVVTLQTAATAGTWSLTLPTSGGSNGFILTTNGSGVTSWTNPTALGVDLDVGTTAITGGTSTRVLYNNAGVLGEYSSVPVALGGTNVTAAGITAFNNITGYTASGATGTTSTNLVFSTSPSITTPTFVTSATGPLFIGGTTASSSLTLQSTSGVGTSDSILFKVGNNGATTAGSISTSAAFSIGSSAAVPTNFRIYTLGTAGSNTGPNSSGTTQSASAVMRLQAGGGFTGTLDIGQGGGTGSWLQSCDTANLATNYALFLNPNGGNVAIGSGNLLVATTTDHNTRVAIKSSGTNQHLVFEQENSSADGWGIRNYGGGGGNLEFSRMTSTTTFTPAMTLDTSGNLGLGVTPSARFDVQTSTNKRIQFTDASHSTLTGLASAILFSRGSDTSNLAGVFGWNTGGLAIAGREGIAFATGGGSTYDATIRAMTLDDSGNLLVNTVARTGSERMALWYSSNTGPGLNIRDTNAQNGNTFIQFNNGATTAGAITSNGTTTMTYGSASDYRLKTNIRPMENALTRVNELKPSSYTWIDSEEFGEGFIAHELQKIFPLAVVGEKNGEKMQQVDYGKLTPLLAAAIQELAAKVAELEAKI
jgi:hypothetical protein